MMRYFWHPRAHRGGRWGHSRTTTCVVTVHTGRYVYGTDCLNEEIYKRWTGRGMAFYGAKIFCGGVR